ncbi:hypothetical protein [Nostoc sp.]
MVHYELRSKLDFMHLLRKAIASDETFSGQQFYFFNFIHNL